MKIPFTKPFLPKKELYLQYLDAIYQSGWITNQGPLVLELEKKFSKWTGCPFSSFVSSGTMGLQLALRSLEKQGEVITTPFSYVATSNAVLWEGLNPVFADILPGKWTLDPKRVEQKISSKTVAILGTHVYGNACEINALAEISTRYKIPVIYDAAHCFGATFRGKSILEYGDMAVLSTHATKIFHTANGGMVFTRSDARKKKIERLKNFGHNGTNVFDEIGINGKNSELHAAMGLAIFESQKEILEARKLQWMFYFQRISALQTLELSDPEGFNYAYFPVVFPTQKECEETLVKAQKRGIELRRYFYPALHELPFLRGDECPITKSLSSRVLCLPMYHHMTETEQAEVLNSLQR